MKLEFLIPGMEHAKESDIGAEVPWIARDLEKRRCAGLEQQAVDSPLVLQRQRGQFMGQREHDMNICGRQEFFGACFEPAVAGVALAFWAVPGAARVIRDGLVSTAGTLIHMPAKRSRAAALDGIEQLEMMPGEPPATLVERTSNYTDHVGHLEGWSLHLRPGGVFVRQRECI